MKAGLALILHAHLPFVRVPSREYTLEEQWLFEAIADVYLPLLRLMDQWSRDGLPWRLTLGVTPVLAGMLDDQLLRTRARRYLEERIELAGHGYNLGHPSDAHRANAAYHRDGYRQRLDIWDGIGGCLTAAWRRHVSSGHLEVLAGPATHPLFPTLAHRPADLRAQIQIGLADYRHRWGRDPRGYWIPECAYTPGAGRLLAREGVQWIIVDTEAFLRSSPPPATSIFAPVRSPDGLLLFGRDPASASQVWDRHRGYPGDPRYREFHADLGAELPQLVRDAFAPAFPEGLPTGLKFRRITGPVDAKEPYDPSRAEGAARIHAEHFVSERIRMAAEAARWMVHSPLMVCPYDAELFGHWWHEGPIFLDHVVRGCCAAGSSLVLQTPSEGLELADPGRLVTAEVPESSWGSGGYWERWVHPGALPFHRQLQAAMDQWEALLRRARDDSTGRFGGILDQAARELLAAQASDWPFLLHDSGSASSGRIRWQTHLDAFRVLRNHLSSNAPSMTAPSLPDGCNLFPWEGLWREWEDSTFPVPSGR